MAEPIEQGETFAERLRVISDSKLAIAREVAARYVARDEVNCVFLTGSLLAGLGSSYSDVDLFVVTADGEDTRPPRQLHQDGQRVDVEYRSTAWLRSLAEEVTFDATTKDLASVTRSKVPYDLTVRVLLSEALKTSPEYEDTVQALQRQTTDLRRLIIGRYAQMAFGNLEDCLGFMVDGDHDSALIVSHDLLLNALQTFTAGCGDMYLGQKWLLRKLGRSAGEYFPLATVADLLYRAGGPAEAVVTQRLRLAQSAITAAVLCGWDSPDAANWPYWNSGGERGLSRSVEWLPMRLADATVLAHRAQRTLKITDRALRVWATVGEAANADEVRKLWSEDEAGDVDAMFEVLITKGALLDGDETGTGESR